MPGCLANPASSHAGRPTHGCQRGRALVQHVQLRRAVAAVLLAPCFTGVLLAGELDVCLQALCSASLLFLNKGYCSSVSTSFKSTSLCKHKLGQCSKRAVCWQARRRRSGWAGAAFTLRQPARRARAMRSGGARRCPRTQCSSSARPAHWVGLECSTSLAALASCASAVVFA